MSFAALLAPAMTVYQTSISQTLRLSSYLRTRRNAAMVTALVLGALAVILSLIVTF
jgi:hypothetical protein